MKAFALLVVLGMLSACESRSPCAIDVGRREAARLRTSYAKWLVERPRKTDAMEVPADGLSKEARAAGFVEGTVDTEIVMLSTGKGEGFVFGRPSSAEIDALQSLGFSFEPTSDSDILRFRLKGKKSRTSGCTERRDSAPVAFWTPVARRL